MKKIDRETVQRILDSADIVEVVSDFVSLKKRGANYMGLCPFHNERTPSFAVSRAKGIYKCFSCGKGGRAINFVMDHEQMSYYEALKYLAKKYNIEIREHEMTDAERHEESVRESMLAVNDFALEHFQHNLTDTPDGRDIGLAYFRERGINDLMIKKFRLGYALDRSDDLLRAALAKGFTEQYLVDTGLCIRSERGTVYDRFKGRVIYPVFTISGRVIAFGGRTLRSDKTVAKYVNSPESAIYSKSNELYGLYQAKQAIVKADKCILVEGYMDVISMHQVGVENVVASSGTSLTQGQIRLIHRFAQNVTVVYDADPAGIKASMRGIDLLLAEGLNIKCMLLPPGEDPDSFAQSHSAAEVEQYIAEHEEDFIRFKMRILLKDAENQPLERANAINSILQSVSVIPDQVKRMVYLQECARVLNIDEKTLALSLDKLVNQNAEKRGQHEQQQQQLRQLQHDQQAEQPSAQATPKAPDPATMRVPKGATAADKLRQHEQQLIKYIIRYGLLPVAEDIDQGTQVSVLDFIASELANDGIELTDPVCATILADALQASATQWPDDARACIDRLQENYDQQMRQGQEQIRREARDLADIEERERQLSQTCEERLQTDYADYAANYLQEMFMTIPDDDERMLATSLAIEKYQLSRVHTKYAHVETERERLPELVSRAVMELKLAILDMQLADIRQALAKCDPADTDSITQLMKQFQELNLLRQQFNKILGERVVLAKQ